MMFNRVDSICGPALTAALLGITALVVAPTPASASVCTDTINTAWSAPGDSNTTTNETSFVACSTTSTLAGDGVVSIDPDPYSVLVKALDGDTFQLLGTINDIGPTGIGDSPFITLVLSDIDWSGGPGVITNVIDHGGDASANSSFASTGFTADTITLAGGFFCSGTGCSLSGVNLGTFDIVARHAVIPLPAAAWLFLTALGGLGYTGWRRKRA